MGKNTSLTYLKAKIFHYKAPFKSTLVFKGNKLKVREGLIVELKKNTGERVFGEISPLPGFSIESLDEALTQTKLALKEILKGGQLKTNYFPSVAFGLDCALNGIKTNIQLTSSNVPLLQCSQDLSILDQYLSLGSPAVIKLKVARASLDSEIKLVQTLIDLNPEIKIRLDANQAWDLSSAIDFFSKINCNNIDYIEEPTNSHLDNLKLGAKFSIALGLDETLQDPNFIYQKSKQIKALVIKPTLIGNLKSCEKWIRIAKEDSLLVSISSSFESNIGLQQLSNLGNLWSSKVQLSFGLDTVKYFKSSSLLEMECIWKSD